MIRTHGLYRMLQNEHDERLRTAEEEQRLHTNTAKESSKKRAITVLIVALAAFLVAVIRL